jgi:hypothetical protein
MTSQQGCWSAMHIDPRNRDTEDWQAHIDLKRCRPASLDGNSEATRSIFLVHLSRLQR